MTEALPADDEVEMTTLLQEYKGGCGVKTHADRPALAIGRIQPISTYLTL